MTILTDKALLQLDFALKNAGMKELIAKDVRLAIRNLITAILKDEGIINVTQEEKENLFVDNPDTVRMKIQSAKVLADQLRSLLGEKDNGSV